jgi:glycosyltransferase involved in cell wall biosynthesis
MACPTMSEATSNRQPDAMRAPDQSAKVLQVLPALGEGGVERGTVDLAAFLVAEGWGALVASVGGSGVARLEAAGGKALPVPLKTKNPLAIHANISRLQKLIQEEGIHLVHARSRGPAWSAYYAARRCGVPFVTTCHGVYSGSTHWLKHRYNAVMASGDRVIAISDFVADHFRERYGVGRDRLRVVARGVDVSQFDPDAVAPEQVAKLASLWRLEEGRQVIMLPGRVVRRKGHLLLLRAIERLQRRDLSCLIVGGVESGSGYPDEIRGEIGTLGLGEVVRMVGPCNDMPAAYMLADVVVAPSTIAPEPFGRVSVEAQAMGKPVVVTDMGGLGETLMPAATGWLVPPDDPGELANALELALAMPEDARARLAQRARDFVVRHFSSEEMCRKTLAIYRELLEGAAAAPGTLDLTARQSAA